MTPLERWSETVQPGGSFLGGGITKLLGAPRMDDLTLLVREAVQNSWDARHPADSAGTVDFGIEIGELTGEARTTLVSEVLPDPPTHGSGLKHLLARTRIPIAIVTDLGTTGLNGPTRADVPAEGGSRNFVDFVRNLGAPRDRANSGGTYGFGKGSYYRVSIAHTLVIHTRTVAAGGRSESRLIAMAIGEPYEQDGYSFTGRHFWGVGSDGEYVEPLTGHAADLIAATIGFEIPVGETGTSMLIMGFDPGIDVATGEPRTLAEAAEVLAEQLVWQCWPKLVPSEAGVAPMRLSVALQGEPVMLPDLQRLPVLRAMVASLTRLRRSDEGSIEIRSQRPKRRLGRLDIKPYRAPDPAMGFGYEPSAGFRVPHHHVALLRSPELVVAYRPGPLLPQDDHGWAGVFLVNEDATLDDAFAAAEPPTHDDWIPGNVDDKGQRSLVNVALREIDTAVRQRFATPASSRAVTEAPLAPLARALGGWFITSGHGSDHTEPATAGRPRPRARQAGGGRLARIVVRPLGFGSLGGTNAHLLEVQVNGAADAMCVTANVGVAVDDGAAIESDPPAGRAAPRVLGWSLDGERFYVYPLGPPVPASGRMVVAVEHVRDAAPIVSVSLVACAKADQP